jgi:hypothetical protein
VAGEGYLMFKERKGAGRKRKKREIKSQGLWSERGIERGDGSREKDAEEMQSLEVRDGERERERERERRERVGVRNFSDGTLEHEGSASSRVL